MTKTQVDTSGDLFIVDNSNDDWKVQRYIREWVKFADRLDVASGYFEIGALLGLEGAWQELEQIRILMGAEVTKQTKRVILKGLKTDTEKFLDDSIETEKLRNDFLEGVPAIVEALKSGQIKCKVYTKDKFHAKAYITHGKQAIIGSTALVGSSNFTVPGLTDNVELNVRIRSEVQQLIDWYERHWNEAEEVSEGILRVMERHTRSYDPFIVYAKALHEYFKAHELTENEWEREKSLMYKHLSQYQKDGYRGMIKRAHRYRGAFLCDSVGLGKTFIGMMVIERLIDFEGKRVALFVPKSARESVWERNLKHYLPKLSRKLTNDLVIFNHTDLSREGDFPEMLAEVAQYYDAIVIDEAHNFRNPGIKGTGERKPSRYRKLFEYTRGKQMYLLTATPVNNSLYDLYHQIRLFAHDKDDYFNPTLGITNLRQHFINMERALEKQVETESALQSDCHDGVVDTNMEEAEHVLADDSLFKELVVQRSRAFVKASLKQDEGQSVVFPVREDPKVQDYSLTKVYGPLLKKIGKYFKREKPLFALAVYNPESYRRVELELTPDEAFVAGRQKQVVSLIRTMFLKRFESSAEAFDLSCQRLLLKLLSHVSAYSEDDPIKKRRYDKWLDKHDDLLAYVKAIQGKYEDLDSESDNEGELGLEEFYIDVEKLNPGEYNIDLILDETYDDLQLLVDFIEHLREKHPADDDKLQQLIALLTGSDELSKHKVLIFSEFTTTARYLAENLAKAGITGLNEIDGATSHRQNVIERFAPYYNTMDSAELAARGLSETRILISTDVLSEGLNLQDATFLINYDLHWNPVKLMQRIGRVDRRLNPAVENKIASDHPDRLAVRGRIKFWNFLPPDELNELLSLYHVVTKKTLKISKTLGIEGKKLLTPGDDFDALRIFNESYDGTASRAEEMRLEHQELLKNNPGLADILAGLPGKVFSGRKHPKPDSKAVFFCYALPARETGEQMGNIVEEEPDWSYEAGPTAWYLYDLTTEQIHSPETGTSAAEMLELIRSEPSTPRHTEVEKQTLSAVRAKVEKYIANTYLKKLDAPLGEKPKLSAWMELS